MSYNATQFRQSEFLPERLLERPAVVVGAGGIGSPAAMVLSKMGFSDLAVYDPDEVEDQNVGSQLYHEDQVGERKADALARFVENVRPEPETFPPENLALGPFSIVVSGVDSMESRRSIWEAVRAQPLVSLYVDARMGLEVVRVYAVDPSEPSQVAFYESTLHPEEEGERLPCSAKAVAYNGFFAAAVIGGLVSARLRGLDVPMETIGDMADFRLAPAA